VGTKNRSFQSKRSTQTKWCVANDLKVHQLKNWLKRIEGSNSNNQPQSKTQWASVAVEEEAEEVTETLQIKVGHESIEVKQGHLNLC
jgi:hypothetical protein